MKPQAPEEISENIEVVTPGALLKEARVALQLAPHEIAKTLNLKASLIEAIEANDFEDMPSITFTRGYLKAYAKLLHVNESEVLEAYEYWSNAEQQQLEMQSFSHRSSQRAMDNWLSIITFMVIGVLIISAIVWWFQRNDTASTNVESPTTVQTQTQKNDPQPKSEEPEDSGAVKPGDKQTAIQLSEELVQSPVQSSVETPVDSELVAVVVEQTQDDENKVLQNQDNQRPNLQVATQQQPNEVSQDESSDKPIDEAVSQINANLTHLELRFSDSCWINIEDSTGERIAIGTKSKGHLTSVYGVAPFTIKLGKPDAVSIWLDGEQKEIPYYPKGSIANFELSKT